MIEIDVEHLPNLTIHQIFVPLKAYLRAWIKIDVDFRIIMLKACIILKNTKKNIANTILKTLKIVIMEIFVLLRIAIKNYKLLKSYYHFFYFILLPYFYNFKQLHLLIQDDNFNMKMYKTEWCPKKGHHDRAVCVYAHNV